jgi:hypothetical protein
MLRQTGKEENGWRDLPFWWPVIFAPAESVTCVFAAETPNEDAAVVGVI